MEPLKALTNSIYTSMELSKCRKCGCMKESLDTMKRELTKAGKQEFPELSDALEHALITMEASEYS